MRQLLAAGLDVKSHGGNQRTVLHHAVLNCNLEVVRGLIDEHNANMFAVDKNGETPFDMATLFHSMAAGKHAFLIECYGNKMAQEHGPLALHILLDAVEYSYRKFDTFRPP